MSKNSFLLDLLCDGSNIDSRGFLGGKWMLRLANLVVVIHFKNSLRCRWAASSIAGSIAKTLDKNVRSWCKPNIVEKAIFP